MERRQVLKELAILTGGIFLVPSCDFSKEDILKAYKNLKITESDKQLLDKICGVIIPSGSVVKGADDLAVVDFVLVMTNDCYEEKTQHTFLHGLRSIEAISKELTGKKLSNQSQDESVDFIQSVIGGKVKGADEQGMRDLTYFLNTTKVLTIEGFMTSEYVMTEIMPYELVPGSFKGKVKIQEGEKVNIYG